MVPPNVASDDLVIDDLTEEDEDEQQSQNAEDQCRHDLASSMIVMISSLC